MELLKNRFAQLGIALIVGICIGAIFYPSKSIRKEEILKYEQTISKLKIEKKDTELEYSMRLMKENQTHVEYRMQHTQKMHSLKKENLRLKSRVSEKKFKIIKPDGTIEEKWFKESETDVVSSVVTEIKTEFTQKVTSIEKKWQKIHTNRVTKIKEKYESKLQEKDHVISSLKKTEKVDINKRNFGISAGMKLDKDYFSNVTYDIAGPIFIGVLMESDQEFNDMGAGLQIGLRF